MKKEKQINQNTENKVSKEQNINSSTILKKLQDTSTQRRIQELKIKNFKLKVDNQKLRISNIKAIQVANKYELLFNHAPAAYLKITSKGRITMLNLTMAEMFHSSQKTIKNRLFNKLVTKRSLTSYNEFIFRIFNSNDIQSCDLDLTIGAERQFNAHLCGINTSENKQEGLITIWDNSVHFKAEEELRLAKKQAEENDQLKSAFLANMSHEIRTPMNGILGFTSLLKEPKLSGEEQKEYIEMIEKSGNRMLNIINDIITISKVEAGQMSIYKSTVNINEIIQYLYTFYKIEAQRKGLQLSCKMPPAENKIRINSDKEKLVSILTNLITNAIKYTEKGIIEFGFRQSSSREIEFFVSDTGIGIPRNKQEVIFERFVQAEISNKRAFEGAGLGLAISKAFTQMLGGKIWVESDKKVGSTFYFTIPYAEKNNHRLSPEKTDQRSQPLSSSKSLKILLAEDDEISIILFKRILKTISDNILMARNGLEALETCRSNPDIDFILMDVKMPEMSGYEATREIRKFNSKVYIIAQTAYALRGEKEKALEAGCNDYITKPINQELLLKLIKNNFNN